ncbi:SUKH-4 family immunity protein [Streptomyces sp. NBC_00344]|uniref:SUKH-4 family immunity protein n=1 Tax=Streptomyces sp. NBC_00344 TaxID=2975720 RepID=UPI002E1C64B9
MSQPLPQLPKPEFALIRIVAPPEAPAQIAIDLDEIGVPVGLIGYEYRPLSEPVFLGGIGERGLVAIATSGLFGRIAVDVATGHVVQIPEIESARARHVNSDLGSFNQCVAAVIARFPFYADGDEDGYEEVAEELRDLISSIDETALADSGFWETFCDDVAIGDFGMCDPTAIAASDHPSSLRSVSASQPSTMFGWSWICLSLCFTSRAI